MATQEVPSIVTAFAAQVKMTPIAWHIEPTYVVIIFEQGPKMRFELQPQTVGAIQHIPLVAGHTKPAIILTGINPPSPIPVTVVSTKGKTFTSRRIKAKSK